MGHDWMIRTLEDMVRLSVEQRMPALAAHLQQAILLAQIELANKTGTPPPVTCPSTR